MIGRSGTEMVHQDSQASQVHMRFFQGNSAMWETLPSTTTLTGASKPLGQATTFKQEEEATRNQWLFARRSKSLDDCFGVPRNQTESGSCLEATELFESPNSINIHKLYG